MRSAQTVELLRLETEVANLVDERRRLLELAKLVRKTAAQPCEIGHADKRRCWEHAHDWRRKDWCHPCTSEALVRRLYPPKRKPR